MLPREPAQASHLEDETQVQQSLAVLAQPVPRQVTPEQLREQQLTDRATSCFLELDAATPGRVRGAQVS